MFEELYLPLKSVEGYLARIGYTGSREPTLETLNALIYAHLTTIPFENLDICELHRGISVEPEALYEKIVTRRRGGYCFELNGLFFSLLTALGFSCTAGATRPAIGETPSLEAPGALSHRYTLVTLEGRRYYVDVGFGGPSPVGALALDETEPQQIRGDIFRVEHCGEDLFLICKIKDGEKLYTHLFSTARFFPPDFVAMSLAMWARPTSPFRQHRMVNLLTENGNLAIEDNVFRRRENGTVTERTFEDSELRGLLQAQFGLVLEEPSGDNFCID